MSENNQIASRDQWGSRIGYILSTLGMSIGVGAVWRFPMMTAQNGGGAFVLAFIIITIVIVIPAGWGETALGRKYKKSVVGTMGEAMGRKGKGLGYLMSSVSVGLLAFYPAIMATILVYIFYTVAGSPFLADTVAFYGQVNDNRIVTYLLLLAINLVTALITLKGIKGGVEKCCKIVLPIMFALVIIVGIRVITLDGISEGIKYYLAPDFSQLKSIDLWVGAAGMALFAVGLGPGYLLTYGSYLSDDHDLATDFLTVNITQVVVCLACGFAIIPALITFGLDPAAGKGILFQTLPIVFSKMPGGMIWFAVFMVALFLAGLSTTVAQMEHPVASFMDGFNISRKKATLIVFTASALLAIPCVWNDAFFAFMDNFVGNVLYCLTAAIIAIYLAWIVGAKKIREEWYNPTSAIKYGSWVDVLYKYIAVPAFIYFAITAVISLF